jgi:hypothetical protein
MAQVSLQDKAFKSDDEVLPDRNVGHTDLPDILPGFVHNKD